MFQDEGTPRTQPFSCHTPGAHLDAPDTECLEGVRGGCPRGTCLLPLCAEVLQMTSGCLWKILVSVFLFFLLFFLSFLLSFCFFLVKLFLLKQNWGQGKQELPVLVQVLSAENVGLQSCQSSHRLLSLERWMIHGFLCIWSGEISRTSLEDRLLWVVLFLAMASSETDVIPLRLIFPLWHAECVCLSGTELHAPLSHSGLFFAFRRLSDEMGCYGQRIQYDVEFKGGLQSLRSPKFLGLLTLQGAPSHHRSMRQRTFLESGCASDSFTFFEVNFWVRELADSQLTDTPFSRHTGMLCLPRKFPVSVTAAVQQQMKHQWKAPGCLQSTAWALL